MRDDLRRDFRRIVDGVVDQVLAELRVIGRAMLEERFRGRAPRGAVEDAGGASPPARRQRGAAAGGRPLRPARRSTPPSPTPRPRRPTTPRVAAPPKPSASAPPRARRPGPACSACGGAGHNRRTCKQIPKAERGEATAAIPGVKSTPSRGSRNRERGRLDEAREGVAGSAPRAGGRSASPVTAALSPRADRRCRKCGDAGADGRAWASPSLCAPCVRAGLLSRRDAVPDDAGDELELDVAPVPVPVAGELPTPRASFDL